MNGPQCAQAQDIIDALAQSGVQQFYICPGNQSSPLAAALSLRNDLTVEWHFDERAAAFMALGYARAMEKAAVVICTSGTAVANMLPAVLEADTAQVPLIVLTADRPEELLATGANQCFAQSGVFSNYLRWQFDLQAPMSGVARSDSQRRVAYSTGAYAVHAAEQQPAGPVHLNLHFRKPFFESNADSSPSDAPQTTPLSVTRYNHTQLVVAETEVRRIAQVLQRAKRGLIVVGALSRFVDRQAIEALANHLAWPLWASVLSGLRRTGFAHLCCSHLYFSLEECRAEYEPDVVLHLGFEPPKPANAVLQAVEQSAATRIYVSEQASRVDPSHSLAHRVQAEPSWFATALQAHLRAAPSGLTEPLQRAEKATREILQACDAQEALSELRVVRAVFSMLNAEQEIVLGNSGVIRLADYAAVDGSPEIVCNRGLSGIDGTLATAAGVQQATAKTTVVLLGDLAALHDLTSLTFIARQKLKMPIVVLNNNGGAIFRKMPQPQLGVESAERFAQYMCTPTGLGFAEVAHWLNIAYHCPETMPAFTTAFAAALKAEQPCLIEVRVAQDAVGDEIKAVIEEVRRSAQPC